MSNFSSSDGLKVAYLTFSGFCVGGVGNLVFTRLLSPAELELG